MTTPIDNAIRNVHHAIITGSMKEVKVSYFDLVEAVNESDKSIMLRVDKGLKLCESIRESCPEFPLDLDYILMDIKEILTEKE